jgi:hypothetical protein
MTLDKVDMTRFDSNEEKVLRDLIAAYVGVSSDNIVIFSKSGKSEVF